jgi:hypothetical protein
LTPCNRDYPFETLLWPGSSITAAINFYHRQPLVEPLVLPEMESRVRARGVGWLLDASPGLTKVDQRECVEKGTYPPTNSSTKMCGQQQLPDAMHAGGSR